MRTALREAEERGDELDDDQGNQHAEEAARGEEEEEEEEEVFCVADAILLRDVAILLRDVDPLLRDVAPKDVPPRAVLPPRDERAGIGLDVRGCIA